jgi:carboxyl-terminal processing protease
VDDIKPIEEDTYAKEGAEILLDFIAINQQAQKEANQKQASN